MLICLENTFIFMAKTCFTDLVFCKVRGYHDTHLTRLSVNLFRIRLQKSIKGIYHRKYFEIVYRRACTFRKTFHIQWLYQLMNIDR